ncbi:MAG: class I SAM-dependent methyltransferase [Candidatus Heimdallarchaeota archaeon]
MEKILIHIKQLNITNDYINLNATLVVNTLQVYHYILIGIAVIWFIVIVSVSWSIIKGAPYSPTRMEKVHNMLKLTNLKSGELIYDLGCGDGRILITAARHFNAQAVGIEIDPFRYLWCQFLISILRLRKKVRVLYGNLFTLDISEADVVVCYLLQKTNDKLEDKLKEELQSNSRIVSNKFLFSSLTAIHKDSDQGIYVYKID